MKCLGYTQSWLFLPQKSEQDPEKAHMPHFPEVAAVSYILIPPPGSSSSQSGFQGSARAHSAIPITASFACA